MPRTLEAENSEALINAQLKRTRSQLKGVEFGQRFLKLTVGVLVFFLLATLLDHWVVSEGLPIWARVVLWLSLIGGILWYATKALLPLLLYRVNPLYAARTIEETKPSLKNSLINYLTLRSEQDRLPSVIYDAIAKQAATGVKDASVDHAVDHAPLIRWGYLLLGLTFCFALYFVISPKNPFRTVARVVVPWSDLTAPSRVQIVEVTPGSAQLYRGKSVKIAARIDGLADEETATLFYTTADGQQREQPIQLKLDDLREYTTLLPAPAEKAAGIAAAPRELAGLQQDFEYYITAGDARSKTFRVQVAAAPYIGVERIEYKYPAYTKKPAETRQGEVNVEALEGTTVTIHGIANQPLKRAWIELRDNAGKPQKFPEMKINDMAASGSWTLGLKEGAREQPDYSEYALRFRNQQNDDNPEPIAYPVKVIRDEAPTIDFLAPSSADISVPWDQPIAFEVRAQDPDFALIEVQLLGMRGDKIAFTQNISSFAAANAHVGNLQKKLSLSPEKLGLRVGDVIDYWATATDNKVPKPNIAQTTQRRLRVIEAQKNNRNPKDDPLANKPPQNQPNQPQDKNQQRDPNQKGQPGDQQPPNNDPNQQPMGNQGQPSNDPNGQGNAQPSNDPTALNNQDQNNQPQNPDPRQQQPDQNNTKQDNPNQDQNQKNPQQNPDNKNPQQQPNGGEAGNKGSQHNKSNTGNKSGEPQPNDSKQPNDGKNNAEQNPMKGGAGENQPQNGKQGNEPQPNSKQDDSKNGDSGKQNPQPGDQNGKPEQNNKPEQKQQSGGRPQEQNNKVNSDGSQDADAIQRLKEHFEKNQKPPQEQASNTPQNKSNDGNPKPQDNKQPSGKQEPGNKNEAGKEPNKEQNGKQEPGKQESGNKQEQSGKQSGGKEGGKEEGQASPSKEPSSQQNGNKQESGKQPTANDSKQPGEQKQTDPNQAAKKQPGEQEPNGGQKPDPMKQEQPGPGNQSGEQTPGKAGAGEKPEPGQKADQGVKPDPNGKEPGDMGQDGNRKSPEKNQPGANAKDSNTQGSKDGNATEPENRQNPKNDQQQQGGKSDPNGSPEAQKKGKPNENASDSNPDGKNNKAESPSNQGNDSASKGEEGGDKAGGGKKGGGQQENKPGRGASGSNTEDEKGANAGKQKGDGETGTKAGNQQKSADKTGKSGDEKGSGTEQKPGDGKQPGGDPGKNKFEGKAGDPGKQPGEPGGQPSGQTGPPREQKQQKNGPAGNMPGGGGNSDAPAVPPEFNGPQQDTPEDKVNDEYAKRATDLVLEQLSKQLRSGNVDQEALNKLGGWNKEEAKGLVDRWETLKREAQQPGPAGDAAATKLQEKLRSLGLRPQQSSNAGDNVADDTQRGNRVNRRSAPPSEYRDIYRAFQKGASGG